MNAATTPLLFHWEPPRRRRAAITIFIIASLVAHALCFYVFQIVYPPTVALLPPPARVGLITSESEEGRTLLRWIEAEDPALTFATHRPPEARLRALPKIAHVPSYLTSGPILKQAPPLIVDLRMPSSQPAGPVPLSHRSVAPSAARMPTTVSFSEELRALGAPNLPAPKFAGSGNEAPENVRFHIGVGAGGEVRFCFRINSSGDPALDEQARNYLVRCRFAAINTQQSISSNPLTWGVATIEWGNDIAHAPPTSTGTSP